MDYDHCGGVVNGLEAEDNATTLVPKDRSTGMVWGYVCEPNVSLDKSMIKKQIKKADKISAWIEAVQIAGFTAAEADKFFGKINPNLANTLEIRLRPPVEVRNDFTTRHANLMDIL
jgi:hypothetical protein